MRVSARLDMVCVGFRVACELVAYSTCRSGYLYTRAIEYLVEIEGSGDGAIRLKECSEERSQVL